MVTRHGVRKALCKFASPVLGSATPKYLSLMDHWNRHKGPEWIAERLKAIHNAALLARNGDLEGAKVVLEDAHVATRKVDSHLARGVEGIVMSQFIGAQHSHSLRKSEGLLKAYTGFTLGKVSSKQYAKARESITADPPGDLGTIPGRKRMYRLGTATSQGIRERLAPYNHAWSHSRFKEYVPSIGGMNGMSTFYTGDIRLPKAMKGTPFASAMTSMMFIGAVPKSVIELCGEFSERAKAEERQNRMRNFPGTYGKITFLQEAGCKARVVCIPSFWNQVYYKPLQVDLSTQIRVLEGDGRLRLNGVSCVLDQNRGAHVLRDWLKRGERIHSFDLSSATDRFPLYTQLGYLEGMGLGKWVRPVEDIAQGLYLNSEDKKNWKYSVGQPMGMNFSYPLFHLTHLSLLEDLAGKCATHQTPSYMVLGDDVVISNSELAKRYRATIEDMGVDISKAKTLEGADVQTFAGFLGVTTPRGVHVFRPFKHGPDFTLQGKELNVLSTLGRDVRKWSSWWSESYDHFVRTTSLRNPDLSPAIRWDESPEVLEAPGSRWFASVINGLMSQSFRRGDPESPVKTMFIPERFTPPEPRPWWERAICRVLGVDPTKVSASDAERLQASETEARNRDLGLLLKEGAQEKPFSPEKYASSARRHLYSSQVLRDPLIREIVKEKRRMEARSLTTLTPHRALGLERGRSPRETGLER